MIRRRTGARQPAYSQRRQARARQPTYSEQRRRTEKRKLERKARKLNRAIRRIGGDLRLRGFQSRSPAQAEEKHLEAVRTRLRLISGKGKVVPKKNPPSLLNKLIEKARIQKQWALVVKALVKEGHLKVNEKTDLRLAAFKALQKMNPRAAKAFSKGIILYFPGGLYPVADLLRLAATKERRLLRIRGKLARGS